MVFFGFAYADNAVDQLSQRLKEFKTYQAKFNQMTLSNSGGVAQKSSGTVSIMPPGRFRWETLKPNHQLLVTDGKTLWVYDADLSQATEQPLNKNAKVNPASLLSGSIADLEKNFVVTETTKDQISQFSLIPRTSNLNFHSIKMSFEGQNLVEMQVVNNLGETTYFKFSHIILNKPMSPSDFKFEAPEGVEVVKQ